VISRRDSGGLRGIVASRCDSGGLGGRIVAPRHDMGGLGGGIVALRRDLGGLGGGIVAPRRDSGGLRGPIKGFGRVGRTRLLDCILGSNGCKAFLLVVLDLAVLARHVSQVARTLLARLEASLRNTESGSLLMQAEQYLESISGVKTKVL
jgi:hypothetical protein